MELCFYGSFLPVPDDSKFIVDEEEGLVPGRIYTMPGHLTINADRVAVIVSITNTADRPIQVGSHYHLAECNPLLKLDRIRAYGKRLNMYEYK